MSLFPIARFDAIDMAQCNDALVRWEHRMGPCNRPDYGDAKAHGLFFCERLVGVVATHGLVREAVGGHPHLTRANTLELSRLCAERSGICRVVLRLWREVVFPGLCVPVVVSYQDADLHSGHTYRFDGWERMTFERGRGVDPRSGRRGRNRWVWAWPPGVAAVQRDCA